MERPPPTQSQRAWLTGVLAQLGITATELARRADLNPTTLTRFLNAENDRGHELSRRTVRKIEGAIAAASRPQQSIIPGFAETEADQYQVEAVDDPMHNAARAMLAGRNSRTAWLLRVDDLDAIGLRRDDVVVVDQNEAPAPGDIVCAQVYDRPMGGARTVFRLYEPPYLVSGSLQRNARRPIVVDNTNAVIMGVMIGSISPRRHEKLAPPHAA